jgi:hypothetical protein
MKYVYGIVPLNGVEYDYDDVAFAASDGRFQIVRNGEVAAVISDSTFATLTELPRAELMRNLTRHQEAIEEIMDYSTVLPVKFGTLLDDEEQVRTLLHLGHDEFVRTTRTIGACVEFDVAVTWEPADVFASIAKEPQIAALKAQVEALSAEERLRASVALGQVVKQAFEEHRNATRDALVQEIGKVVRRWQLNPLMDDNMVMNVACLVSDEQLSSLEATVMALDKQYEDGLQFRLIGPLPPYSFATVEARVVRPNNLSEACQLLDLPDNSYTLEQIKHAYYHKARQMHPDVAGNDAAAQAAFVRLTEAYRLMTDIARQAPSIPLGDSQAPRILVRVAGVNQ